MASAPLAPRNSHACPKTAATSLARVLFGLLTSLQIRLSLNISEGDNTKERKGKEKKGKKKKRLILKTKGTAGKHDYKITVVVA